MALGDKNYPKIRIIKQEEYQAASRTRQQLNNSFFDPHTHVNTVAYQFGYNTGVFSPEPTELIIEKLDITRGINSNLGSCTFVITNLESEISSGVLPLGNNEYIEIGFSPNKKDSDRDEPIVWFRGFIQKVKYVKINNTLSNLVVDAVGEGVILKERLTKIDRLRPFGTVTEIDETSTPPVHDATEGFFDATYKSWVEADTTDKVKTSNFFQQGGFNFDVRTRVQNIGSSQLNDVTAKFKLRHSFLREQTGIKTLLYDMFGNEPIAAFSPITVQSFKQYVLPASYTVANDVEPYISPLVIGGTKFSLLNMWAGTDVDKDGTGVDDIPVVLPQFSSDYGTMLSAIDTLSATVNAIYYLDNIGQFYFKQNPVFSGLSFNIATNVYGTYDYSDDIHTNGYSVVSGLGFKQAEYNIFTRYVAVNDTTRLNAATKWDSAGTSNYATVNENSFRRANHIAIEFTVKNNVDISSIELPLLRISTISNDLEWEIREKSPTTVEGVHILPQFRGNDATNKTTDSALIKGTGVIKKEDLNILIPYLYETWNNTLLTDRAVDGHTTERLDNTFNIINADSSNNLQTSNSTPLIELPVVATGLEPNTSYLFIIKPPIDCNGTTINNRVQPVATGSTAGGFTGGSTGTEANQDNILFVYRSGQATIKPILNAAGGVVGFTIIDGGFGYVKDIASKANVTLTVEGVTTGTRPVIEQDDITITNGIITSVQIKAANQGSGFTADDCYITASTPTLVAASGSNICRYGVTPDGNGSKLLTKSVTTVNGDNRLGVAFNGDTKTTIPLVLGRIPIKVNIQRGAVVTSENDTLINRYGLREISIPFPSNANINTVRTVVQDLQNNLYNNKNRIYSDIEVEFPRTKAIQTGETVNFRDDNILLNKNLLVSEIDISVDAGKGYTDRVTIKCTELVT